MKTNITVYKAAIGGKLMLAAIVLAVLALSAHPEFVAAQEPYHLAQARQRIAQIDNSLAQWNRFLADPYLFVRPENDAGSGRAQRWSNDAAYRQQYEAWKNRELQRAQENIRLLTEERAQHVWLVQSWYSPGQPGSSTGPTQGTTGTPSTGSAGGAKGGLLNQGNMQR